MQAMSIRIVRLARGVTIVASLAALLLSLTVVSAHADTTACKRAVAKASSQFVQAKMKALQKCDDHVVAHTSSGPCPDATAAGKIAKADSKLRAAVNKGCGGADRTCGTGLDDEALAGIGWSGGACRNFENGSCTNAITSCTGVSDCLACVGNAAVDQAITLYYGSANVATTDPVVISCQRAIGKYTAKFFTTKSKALQKCEDRVISGTVSGPCPDAAKTAPLIQKAEVKARAGICKKCGGTDRLCGGGDDLSPAAIGFSGNCPNVTVPGGGACGGPVGNLTQLVNCVACVTEFKADCVDALAAPTVKSYPPECNGGAPVATVTATPGGGGATPTAGAQTPTRTATPAGPTVTSTPGGGVATRTATATPPPAATATATATPPPAATTTSTPPPAPTTTPTPPGGAVCVLPNPMPDVLSFVGRPGTDLDTGWTGQGHDLVADDLAPLSAARLVGCDTNTSSPTCGQCSLQGPVLFPAPAKNCFCFNLTSRDSSTLTECDPEVPSSCTTAGESCQCFYGPPLPISSGGVPVCVVNRYTAPLTGTANIADSGPHAGEGAAGVHLEASVHTGAAVEQPCPTCVNDTTPRDGIQDGTCNGGVRAGQSCDVQGDNVVFGQLSMDCLPARSANVGNLKVDFTPATTGTTTLGTGPRCTAGNATSFNCFCDTCADASALPCNSNADCAPGIVCGGRRCTSGANVGFACTTGSQCPGGSCGRPGQQTAPNACDDNTCSADAADPNPNDGVCSGGPFDNFCTIEKFRGCLADGDCQPPPDGNCGTCAAGQTCGGDFRNCFLDPIVRTGAPGTQNAVLAATFCIPPTSSTSVNTVAGLPGPGALALPIRIFESGSQCGNGVVNSGEDCDGSVDTACPGACLPDCQCPICGDNQVNRPGEQCDGSDDTACPGQCTNCTCPAGTCGDNVVSGSEQCDGTADAACPGHCQNCVCQPFCGDGIINNGEPCDGSATGGACPASACTNCTCGPFCGNNQIDPGEQCDGNGTGSCLGTCEGNCTCSAVCGDNQRQAGELCDGTDDTLCPGKCSNVCTCPANGQLTFVVTNGADLDTGWTGIAHDSAVQAGSKISGELSNCDGVSDQVCDFFGNVASRCSGDPSRLCTNTNQCSGAGNCLISTFGPPLPLSAGGVPACIVNRFATDVTGTYNLQTGSSELFTRLNSLVHLGSNVSQPCPICDCTGGNGDPHTCALGASGTCTGIVGSPACHVQGNGPFGPTSNDCPPSSSLNVSGGGLDIPFTPLSTGTVSFATNQKCDGSGFTNQDCWCDGQPQETSCDAGCDGGANDGQPCDSDAQCPGAPAGACKPLCRQYPGHAAGEGLCVVGPADQTCAGAPEVGCTDNGGCPSGKGPCVSNNRRCFMDPIVRTGVPSTTMPTGVATFCIPATTGTAINQTAGLPGPGALRLPTTTTIQRCGDNVLNNNEECDGPAADDNCPGACLANCKCNTACGNNVVEFGEQCDGTSSAACPGQCIAHGQPNECTCPPVCGDGFVGPGEVCDQGGVNGAPASDAACPGTCVQCQCPVPTTTCLNQQLDAGEVCDLPAIGCGPLQVCLACQSCFPPPDVIPPETGFICGNGNIEPTEICELPSAGCGDGEICLQCTQCVPTNLPPVCGNLNLEAGEVCELPAQGCGPLQACLLCQQCVDIPIAICGNGNIEPGEACELPARGCGPLQVCLACTQCAP